MPQAEYLTQDEMWTLKEQTATVIEDDGRTSLWTGLYDQWGNPLYHQPIKMGFSIDV
jgi:hypothetical protein